LAGVAASIVLPGHRPGVSRFTVHVTAAYGSTVEYLPEATVITARAHHEAVFRASLAGDARLVARELLVLGRDGEQAGHLVTETVVNRDRTPVLNQSLTIDDTAASSAVLAGRRVLATVLKITGDEPCEPVAHDWCSRVPLAAGGSLTTALAADAVSALRLLDQLDRSG
ncbi:urease accessory protein UreD, partial [Kibdelosporangium lantanae]